MGFTHYYRFHKAKVETETRREIFSDIAEEIKLFYGSLPRHSTSGGDYYSDYPIVIRGGLGKGKPIINESQIWFNGDESKGMDHETFSIEWNIDGNEDIDDPFEFCKTARKPYDLLVCVSLISFTRHFNRNVFRASSDGKMEDWKHAIEFYNEIVDFDATEIVAKIISGEG